MLKYIFLLPLFSIVALPAMADVVALDGAVVVNNRGDVMSPDRYGKNSYYLGRSVYGDDNTLIINGYDNDQDETFIIKDGKFIRAQDGTYSLGNGQSIDVKDGRANGNVGGVEIRN